jgi:hypothetical protein
MAARRKFVNLDAMIPREDFEVISGASEGFTAKIDNISLRDFERDAPLLPNLRKPDFQRETNHWSPEQVASLVQCFAEGDLIPSVILWSSPQYVFVIDGGHRLSALRAWIEDDFGDGPLSLSFFGHQITEDQIKAANETRRLVLKDVGSWQHWRARNKQPDLPEADRIKAKNLSTRAIPVQWVLGDAEKAEASFYRINTQGTPLDDIEELLIRNRRRPAPIAARSIIRAGMGHKYWSRFTAENRVRIENAARMLYQVLFEPELDAPIKTLDLPLGGVAGVRTALSLLIDFVLIASRNQQGTPAKVDDQPEDETGELTIQVLEKSVALAGRITGNTKGSLGLHPAVYFYGPSGRHAPPLFMGMVTLIARKVSNNDDSFFRTFTECRKSLEDALLKSKPLLAAIIQQTRSVKRYATVADVLDHMIKSIKAGEIPSEQQIIDWAGVSGKVIVGRETVTGRSFSEDTKSATYLRQALEQALRCPICNGYLDPQKSVSYDHRTPRRNGGLGSEENCQLTHPYCNQAMKN